MSIKELREQAKKLNAAVWKAEREESDRQNAALVGRTFKFRNSYGGCDESEKWWLYGKVIDIKDGGLLMFRFQTDNNGRIEIEPAQYKVGIADSGYQEIPEKEFDRAWAALLIKVNRL